MKSQQWTPQSSAYLRRSVAVRKYEQKQRRVVDSTSRLALAHERRDRGASLKMKNEKREYRFACGGIFLFFSRTERRWLLADRRGFGASGPPPSQEHSLSFGKKMLRPLRVGSPRVAAFRFRCNGGQNRLRRQPPAAAPTGRTGYSAGPMGRTLSLIALAWLVLARWAVAAEVAPTADPHAWSAEYWPQLRVERQDGEHWARFGGRLVLDGAQTHYDKGLRLAPKVGWSDTDDVRQARLFVEGLLFRRLELKTEADFAPESPVLTDAYLGLRGLGPLGTARIGHHKQPFSFERQMSRKYLVFMERSLTEALDPSLRDVGFSLRSAVLDQRLRWVIGGFRDTKPTGHDFPRPANWSLSARATGLPFWEDEGRRLVHLGASYNHEFRDDATFSISQPPESFVAGRLVGTGRIGGVDGIDRVGLDAVWVHGPVSVQGEWTHDFLDRTAGRGDLDFWGFYVQASWFVTGEYRRYERSSAWFSPVIPIENFAPSKGQWGAVQLGVRFSYLDLDDKDVRGGIQNDVGVALNWFLFPQVRLSGELDLRPRERPGRRPRPPGPAPDRVRVGRRERG